MKSSKLKVKSMNYCFIKGITWDFRFVAEAISPIGKEEVLDAKMAVEGAAASNDYILSVMLSIESIRY